MESPWTQAYRKYFAEIERHCIGAARRGRDLGVSPPQYLQTPNGYGFTVHFVEIDPGLIDPEHYPLGKGWMIYKTSSPEAQALVLSLTPSQP